MYVSVLAELGLPAFLLFMILLGYPIIGRKGTASCIAAIATFNVFLLSIFFGTNILGCSCTCLVIRTEAPASSRVFS